MHSDDQVDGSTTNPQPGTVIGPTGTPLTSSVSNNSQAVTSDQQPNNSAQPPVTTSEPETPMPAEEVANNDNPTTGINWVGPEYIARDKSGSWLFLLIVAVVVVGGLTYLLTRSFVSVATIDIILVVLGVYGLHRPKDIIYAVNNVGLVVGQRQFSYAEFKSFTAVSEGDYLDITLLPLKRFALPIGLLYQGKDQEQLLNFLSDRLPMNQQKLDLVDNLMQKIKF